MDRNQRMRQPYNPGEWKGVMESGDMADGAEMGSSDPKQARCNFSGEEENVYATGEEAEKAKERIPDDIPMDGTGEDVIARQIREAAIQEDDPLIREALWE
ncbi:MAG: hypothetical protein Ct9H300mP4_13710 [Gammaproteobacteria bacterium]|nr:MAG: hypothetical protein Ct9H300mP4_13710 [Gammaproteobacteria bacterium]